MILESAKTDIVFEILAKCTPNDVGHLDFGWPGGKRVPAVRGGGKVKTFHNCSGRDSVLELSLRFQNLNSLVQHAMAPYGRGGGSPHASPQAKK